MEIASADIVPDVFADFDRAVRHVDLSVCCKSVVVRSNLACG